VVTAAPQTPLAKVFRAVVARRWAIVALYAAAAPVALLLALRVPKDNSIERMVVPSDPVVTATRAFQKVFPEPAIAFLVLEARDPLAAAPLAAMRSLQRELDAIPHVSTYSLLSVAERLGGGGTDGEALHRLVARTSFFRRQGLVGDGFLGVVVNLDVAGAAQRDEALASIDRAVAATTAAHPALGRVRRVGAPWVDAWLERETAANTVRFFPLFGAFVVLLILGLYRSFRALAVILVSLAVAVLLGMAFAALAGFAFTIVSALVPLTLMVTATASLVYLHSRFVDQPEGVDLETHRIAALENKLVAVSASVFAAAVGFAALTVSHIRPIRELGIWTAAGLALGWVVCFTLYPALQVILRAPTRRERRVAGAWVVRAAQVVPRWSYRWRWQLLASFLALSLAGLAALFGVPGAVAPMRLQTDALDYVNHSLPVWRDTKAFGEHVLGLASVKVWVTTPAGGVLDPGFLAALDGLSRRLDADPAVGSVVGLPAVLRLRRELAGQTGEAPTDAASLARQAGDLEQLLLTEPALRAWVDMSTLGSTYLTVTARAGAGGGSEPLQAAVRRAWEATAAGDAGLRGCSYRVVGASVLADTIGGHLVPTLVQSFAITFGIIFTTFLLVFRSGAARLNAMLPSLFAILVTFLLMRIFGIPLNVATILIATTVLGATENDQIHFFYHYQERRGEHSTERSVAHAIRVAGHAIVFATLINASGFLALSLSELPPMRQFGIITATAFFLALLADFTVLPAALWILHRERPDDHPAAG
jgi:uncharacterized protein